MTDSMDSRHRTCLERARRVLDIEQQALQAQSAMLDQRFVEAVDAILETEGRLVVVGMGKSGIIAKKIAATFASTGTPAFFVHAAEAQHGDLGMITTQDAVLALSHSGETEEVLGLLPMIKRLGIPLIAITGKPASSLGRYADIILHVPVDQEACPMNLAPTASTTTALALGDALAVVVLEQRGFAPEDFARFHPAGSLGRRLMRVEEVMHHGRLPVVTPETPLREAIVIMSRGRLGITAVLESGSLIGCLTDGDLRRILESGQAEMEQPVSTFMHRHPYTVPEGHLASEALHLMEEHKITVILVVNTEQQLTGMLHMHDLLQAKVA